MNLSSMRRLIPLGGHPAAPAAVDSDDQLSLPKVGGLAARLPLDVTADTRLLLGLDRSA